MVLIDRIPLYFFFSMRKRRLKFTSEKKGVHVHYATSS